VKPIFLAALFVAAGMGQTTVRDLDPRLQQSIKRQIEGESLPTVRQLNTRIAPIRRDTAASAAELAKLSKTVADLIGEMAAIRMALAEKDTSRVTRLEDRVDSLIAAKMQAEARADRSEDRILGAMWACITSALIGGVTFLIGLFRARRNDQKLAVLTKQTDGMVKQISELALEKGYQEGLRAAGKQDREGDIGH
jgi:hypothetical protein